MSVPPIAESVLAAAEHLLLAPSGLTLDDLSIDGSSVSVSLRWTGTDDSAGYRVYRNGTLLGTTASTGYSDTLGGKTPTATYYIVAFDAAGNLSAATAQATAQ